jgi:hypothetical protein
MRWLYSFLTFYRNRTVSGAMYKANKITIMRADQFSAFACVQLTALGQVIYALIGNSWKTLPPQVIALGILGTYASLKQKIPRSSKTN